jgi:hypothetical protein
VLRKRITFTLVTGLLIQTVSAMLVINTTLMSIATVEGEEEQGLHLDQAIEAEEEQALEVTNNDLMGCLQVLMGQQVTDEVDPQVLADCLHAQGLGLPEPKDGG